MQNIADSITNLIRKADELKSTYGANHWEGHEDMRNLWSRLRGERDGFRYALEMMGLKYVSDAWDDNYVPTHGRVQSSDFVRDARYAAD